MKKLSMLLSIAAGALLFSAFVSTESVHAQGAPAPSAGNAAAGKTAFMRYGCYECHGTQGQGNFGAGPAIAPHPMPYSNFLTYIRAPRGEMPPFDERVLPAGDAQNIFAYLETIPAGQPASSISALSSIGTGTAGTPQTSAALAHGRVVFNAYCLKCHGSAPIGPGLGNEKSRKDLAATIEWTKNPAPPMPKLFPSPLSEQDVDDVAAYVQTL
jgi:ubiquinol-cytochrome c reductase cytochrome c subunit